MYSRLINILWISLFLMVYACHQKDQRQSAIQEITETEKAFCFMAQEKGIQEAFTYYAADSGIVRRGERLIIGKKAIYEHYGSNTLRQVKLTWTPDFVDASTCGDLGYTYGRYNFSALDTTGAMLTDSGYFHTVWKRQPDGTWKFVWD
jgi:ketosteroid isomerase-like protein